TVLTFCLPHPAAFLAGASWPDRFGSGASSFVERTAHGRSERRVLYADGTDVDVVPVAIDEARTSLREPGPLSMLARGHRILVDKDRLLEDLPALVARTAGEEARLEDWPASPVPFENPASD